MLIRPETTADHESIRQVNRLAFGQDAEARLVDALRDGGYVRLSLVAERDGQIVGHILFSDLPIITETGSVEALSLAPMAILPAFQRQGIGSALVRRGLEACRDQGHRIVIVLGHPDYYPRFGFSAKLAEPLSSPFGGGEAWMALELVPGALAGVAGKCERDWRCLKLIGPIPFTTVGVLASLVQPLADAGISVFAISTFDTDYVLVKDEAFEKAVEVLGGKGHTVSS